MFTKPVTDSYLIRAAGVFILCFALVFMLITLIHFKNSLRFGLDKKNCGELITTGVFAFSRNPFFLSLGIYFVGIALLQLNLFFIGFTVLAFTCIHFFILKEEKFMRVAFGAEYLEYMQKVRRYL
jgi:protein-S-isoprenylcysteine O-methyltransferase Ste14